MPEFQIKLSRMLQLSEYIPWIFLIQDLWSLISKRNISKNTKMELTLDTFIKFNVESVPGVHSFQKSFLPPPKWVAILKFESNYNISS